MRRLAKFWSITRHEKKLLCEASVLLLLSKVSIRTIAFKHIDSFLRTRWRDDIEYGNDREQEIWLLRRSVSRAATILPGKSRCLSRSIVEFIMMRRRGIPAVMLAGAKFSSHSSLEAHAWVATSLRMDEASSENSEFATVIRIGRAAVDP